MDQISRAEPLMGSHLSVSERSYQFALSWYKSVFSPYSEIHKLLRSIRYSVIAEQEALKHKVNKINQEISSLHGLKIGRLNESGCVVAAIGYCKVERQLRRDVQRMAISITSMILMLALIVGYLLQESFGGHGLFIGAIGAVMIVPLVTRLAIGTVLKYFAPSCEAAAARRARNISLNLVVCFNKIRLDQRLPALPDLFSPSLMQRLIVCSSFPVTATRRRSEPMTSITSYASLVIEQIDGRESPSPASPCLALIMRGREPLHSQREPIQKMPQENDIAVREVVQDRRAILLSQPATELDQIIRRVVSAPELGARELKV